METQVDLSVIDLSQGNVVLVKHDPKVPVLQVNAIRQYFLMLKESKPDWKDKVLWVIPNNLEIEVLPLGSVKQIRDKLNEVIYDRERGK